MPDSPPPFPQPKPQPRPGPQLPKEIGGYQIQRLIGSGGMATVYAAVQKQPRRTVALKVMKAGAPETRGENALRRFKREVEILGKLNHPYIAQVFDAGVHDDGSGGVPYFVMEYVSSARNILEHVAAKSLDLRDRLKLFVKVCAAVEHGHKNKIIHRDLKPGNILIDAGGDPKVIDFGVARSGEMDVSHQTIQTDAGRLVGTLHYMSPEQVDTTRQDLDARCDVWALGVLLYKLLTGHMPHDLQGLPIYEAARIIREEEPTPPGELKPELRGDLETIILKALERDRSRRYTNAGSLGRDIVRFLADKPIHARRAGLVYRGRLFAKRHRTALIAATIVVLVTTAAATMVVLERLNRPTQPVAMATSTADANAASMPDETRPTEAPAKPPRSPITLSQQTGPILSLAFDSTGSRLASGSRDHTVIVWEVASRAPAYEKRTCDGAVTHLAFSGDGSTIAVGTDDNTILTLNARTGKLNERIRHASGKLRCLAMNARGSLVAFGGEDLTLRLMQLPSRQTQTIRSTTGVFTCATLSDEGLFLAAGSAREMIHLYTARNASFRRRLNGPPGEILAVAFRGEEELFAAADSGKAMHWARHSEEDRMIQTFTVSDQPIIAAAFDATRRRVAVVNANEARIVDLNAPNHAPIVLPLTMSPVAVAITSSGEWCAVGDDEGNVHLLPLEAP